VLKPARTESDLPTQIAQSLLAYIRSEEMHPGDKLPSQTILAEHLHVSRTSLREALARLQTEGLIRQVHGVGTFVAQDPHTIHSSAQLSLSITEMLQSQGIQPDTSEVNITILTQAEAPPDVVRCLDREQDEKVFCLRRVRTADGTPFAFVVAYITGGIPNLSSDPEAYRGSLYAYLEENCREFIQEADSEIEARITDKELAERLGIPVGAPLLTLRQCHYNAEGRAIIHSTDNFVQNRMRLKIRRKRYGQNFFQEET